MRKTYEVLLCVYLFLALLLLLVPIWMILQFTLKLGSLPDCVMMSNPFWLAYLPYLRPGTSCLDDQVLFLAVSLGVSAFLCVVAVLRVRRVALRQSALPQRRKLCFSLWRGLPGPSLDFNPVLWREWNRKRSSRWSLFAWMVYAVLALMFTLFVIAQMLSDRRNRDPAILANAFQVPVGLLLLSVGSVTALAEERASGSLDVLLTTPLSTLQILQGMWWAAFRPVLFLTVLPGMVALAAVATSSQANEVDFFGPWVLMGLILAYGAALTSLGLALALWISRPGRAQVASVMVVILMVVVPVLPLFFSYSRETEYFAQASPFFAMGQLTMSLIENRFPFGSHDRAEKILFWSFVWLIFYLGAALLLFVLSLWTFDGCLGRVRRTRPPGFPPHNPDANPYQPADAGRSPIISA
jgi:ABC-type transport system involved in multi-copper enzyme maturation permease subunit